MPQMSEMNRRISNAKPVHSPGCAQCNCSFLSVRHEQSQQLFSGYREWQTTYWRPLLINREFASHFRRSAFRQMLVDFTAWLHRRLLQQRHHDYRQDELEAMYPAE